jgi:hypothetical protein
MPQLWRLMTDRIIPLIDHEGRQPEEYVIYPTPAMVYTRSLLFWFFMQHMFPDISG